MRLLLQRVSRAKVTVNGEIVGQIGRGFLILTGFKTDDDEAMIGKMAEKCLNLRVFEDDDGKMNRSVIDSNGGLLVVSQFTLYANCRKGRRPGFDRSMPPDRAEQFYDNLVKILKESGLQVETGIFGAKMEIELVNDGPVTIMLDDEEIFPNK